MKHLIRTLPALAAAILMGCATKQASSPAAAGEPAARPAVQRGFKVPDATAEIPMPA
jgi:hypothetical protein